MGGKMAGQLYMALAAAFLLAPAAEAAPDTTNEKVLHLLNRITYGPSPGALAEVKQMGMDAYIDQQLHPERIAPPPALAAQLAGLKTLDTPLQTLIEEYPPARKFLGMEPSKEAQQAARQAANIIPEELIQARLIRAVESPAQLQEVMTDFWYNHFNVFAEKEQDRWLVSSYERDAIRPYTLGKFRDLLEATAEHPAMMVYLDNWLNTAPDSQGARGKQTGINENYAREIMELHTMGAEGGYTQADVTTLAYILTGWGLGKGRRWRKRQRFILTRSGTTIATRCFSALPSAAVARKKSSRRWTFSRTIPLPPATSATSSPSISWRTTRRRAWLLK